MISIVTNILLPAVETGNTNHRPAVAFLGSLQGPGRCGGVRVHPARSLCAPEKPCGDRKTSPSHCGGGGLRSLSPASPLAIIGFPTDSRTFHAQFWKKLRETDFSRRRAYDWRVALVLLQSGVTEFATVNEQDFRGFGFKRVWNPLLFADA